MIKVMRLVVNKEQQHFAGFIQHDPVPIVIV